jgi:hypothetical protein
VLGAKRRARRRAERAEVEQQAVANQLALERVIYGRLLLLCQGQDPLTDPPMVLKKDERAVFVVSGVGLFEPRRTPGHWEGHSSGFSIPVAGGIRWRVGQSRGHYVQGDEVPTTIDHGTFVITTQRAVFEGTTQTREWAFGKLVAVQHYANRPWSAIQVSNRQKVSGIIYDPSTAGPLRTAFDVALGVFHGEAEHFIEDLAERLASEDATPAP